MNPLSLLLLAASLLAASLKLFTYEFHLPDDPTCGIALRAVPSLQSRALLGGATPSTPDLVLLQDENAFLGQDLYRFVVGVAWLALPALFALTLIASRLRERRA